MPVDRADDDRRGRAHARTAPPPEDIARVARRVGRRRDRPQLLGRAADDPRSHRAHGAAHPAQAQRPAERRHAASRSTAAACTWPAPSTWPPTHAISCRRARRSSAAAAAPRPSTSARWSEGVRPLAPRLADGAHAGPRSRAVAASLPSRRRRVPDVVPLAERSRWGRKLARRRVRDVGGDRAAARRRRRRACSPTSPAQGRRRRRRQRARRSARAEPHGRPADQRAHRAAGGHRNGDALRLPRPQPARHALATCSAPRRSGCATCCSSPATRRRWDRIPTPPRCSTSTRSA